MQQAAQLDQKLDDGLPLSGKVTAIYVSGSPERSRGGPVDWGQGPAIGTAAAANGLSCYDNDNNASLPMHYTLDFTGPRNGSEFTGYNCALSFEMQ